MKAETKELGVLALILLILLLGIEVTRNVRKTNVRLRELRRERISPPPPIDSSGVPL